MIHNIQYQQIKLTPSTEKYNKIGASTLGQNTHMLAHRINQRHLVTLPLQGYEWRHVGQWDLGGPWAAIREGEIYECPKNLRMLLSPFFIFHLQFSQVFKMVESTSRMVEQIQIIILRQKNGRIKDIMQSCCGSPLLAKICLLLPKPHPGKPIKT